MARKTPRFSQPAASIDTHYDSDLVRELNEKFITNVPYSERNPTITWAFFAVLDGIMRTRDIGGLHGDRTLRWNGMHCFTANSNMGTFLRNNFARDHRVFRHVRVYGYAPDESTLGGGGLIS